ncbi:MAG: hypothetical protein JWP84_2789 [Tardiphaga sp.]|jgi:hypothetical protein|nr:hypothetical protein [Tardiphaga sp.]
MAGKKDVVWFALTAERPLFAFAGIWTDWTGTRGTKANPVEGDHRLYGFLTTERNGMVAPVHAKAMPVLLATPEEHDVCWRPLPGKDVAGDGDERHARCTLVEHPDRFKAMHVPHENIHDHQIESRTC